MTEDRQVGWKFGADIKGPDGHFVPRTCFVAELDREAAVRALSDAHPGHAAHPGPGQAVSLSEWSAKFEATPLDGEVRCDG